jgi:hypothetical protein
MRRRAFYLLALWVAIGVSHAAENPANQLPITEITMERPNWYLFGRSEKVVLRSDGTATLDLATYSRNEDRSSGLVQHQIRTGLIHSDDYQRLAALLRSVDYPQMPDSYGDLRRTHQKCVVTSAVIGGKRKQVLHYNDRGPASLWAIERVIWSFVREISWKTVDAPALKRQEPQ